MERRNTTHQFLSTAKRFVFSLFCGILAQLSTQANTFFWPMAGTSGRFCEGTPWGSSHATFYFLCVLHVGGGKWWQDVSLQMVQVQTKCSVLIKCYNITCFFQSIDCKASMSTSTYCRSFIVSFSIFYAEEQRIC